MGLTLHLYNGGAEPTDYPLKAGSVINDQLNETRDSATVVARVKGGHMDIESFDYAVIDGESCGKQISPVGMIVDTFSEEKIGYGSEEEYEVTIHLFSQTKEMERADLPNRSITALADGTHRSVLYYLREFLNEYAPKYRIKDPNNQNSVIYANAWKLSSEAEERFGSVDCPEFAWNTPTLAEVVTDLMMVDDCIPTIKGNVVGFIDLKERKGEVLHPERLNATRQMSSADYNQDLRMNLTNAIGSRTTRIVEYISFRNATESVQTTRNLQLITQKPIYAIKSVKAVVREIYNDPQYAEKRITTLDLSGNIKEQDAYNVLDPTTSGNFGDASYYPTAKRERQIANAYYKRGGNIIEGWSKEFQLAIGTETAIEFIIDHEMKAEQGHWINTSGIDYRDIMFAVEYEALSEMTVSVGRKLPLRNCHTSSFDNQGSSYVDIGQQTIFEYMKANRLGNKLTELSGTFLDPDHVPTIGQTYEGAVIFSTEASYFDDCILFHGYATDDYVLANYFVAVRAKRRSWAIASGSEALTRHENVKYYAEFSHKRKTDVFGAFDIDYSIARKLLSPLERRFNDDTIKLCAFNTRGATSGSSFLPGTGYYIVDCSAEAAGMSVVFSIQFTDNYSAGVKQITQTLDNNTVQRINKILPYADSHGEFFACTATFLSYYDPADGDFIWPRVYADTAGAYFDNGFVPFVQDYMWNDMKAKGMERPYSPSIATSEPELDVKAEFHKDNREIFGMTFQIEFCADEPSIVISRRFVDMQRYVHPIEYQVASMKKLASAVPIGASQLPTPSDKYVGVGYLVNPNYPSAANRYVYYRTRLRSGSETNYEWYSSNLSQNEKLAVLVGYERSLSSADSSIGVAGFANRVRVYEYAVDDGGRPSVYDSIITARAVALNHELDEDMGVIDDSEFTSAILTATSYGKQVSIDIPTNFINGARAVEAKSWAVVDEDYNFLFGVNLKTRANPEFKIWLNFLRTRGEGVSESIEERQVVSGTISSN